MRLNKIKLAGFKSFVDPTTFELKSNLTAVVGPNGCGKSNIVDAVRWVTGESSAKQLRGESLTDVIFNGSATRKPVGKASIELVFDNTDSTLGGEYAAYSEISIRRELARDGQSVYFLNGTRCRRRDIVDVFLGTGLGPRSYAIIEQGMITRLIESKPEELRVNLEEVAGISKYKERRRETENRIRHTRDNLDRLTDVRDEITKQLAHLKRQARAAERFTELKQEERLVKAQLEALHWRELNDSLQGAENAIKDQETELEAKIAEHRNLETQLEKLREQQHESNEVFNEVQARFYRSGADIARLEQSIEHQNERRQQLENDLNQLQSAWEEARQNLNDDQAQVTELTTEQEQLAPQCIELKEQLSEVQLRLTQAEQTAHEINREWEDFNQQAQQTEQQFRVEQTRLQQLTDRQASLQKRADRIEQELGQLDFEGLPDDISELEATCAGIQQRMQAVQTQLASINEQISSSRDHIQQLQNQLDETRESLHGLRARQSSLQALQQAAMGDQDEQFQSWLKQHGFADKPRLISDVEVENGWERAVETVLGAHLQAYCVSDVHSIREALQDLNQGSIELVLGETAVTAEPSNKGVLLASKITSRWPVGNILAGVYVADSLTDALALRDNLAPHESVVTRDGIWVGANWLRVCKATSQKDGIIEREKALNQLAEQIPELKNQVEQKQEALHQARANVKESEEQRDALQQEFRQISTNYSEMRAQLSAKQTTLQQLQQRSLVANEEWQEVKEQLENINQQQQQAEQAHAELEQQTIEQREQREILAAKREQADLQLGETREQASQLKQQTDEIDVRFESTQTQSHYLQQAIERNQKQLTSFQEREEQLTGAIAQIEEPLQQVKQELEAALGKRVAVENELTEAKTQLGTVEHEQRVTDRKRQDASQSIDVNRQALEQMRMQWQANQVRRETHREQVEKAEFTLDALLEELNVEDNVATWEESVETLERKINRLGPINLAAIDEHTQLDERKTYLDAQDADLCEALAMLENAIHKIDKETRARLQETYDKVNEGFSTLFPKVFGGGQAYLELVGEDLLSSGVQVRAQPPGKRNTTIHLLSGGEKALTAIALVFAMFQLSPAPFCILDEVDAPLDDVNVGRYCNLVKDMSSSVQFIFISHNKVAIEMAEQLVGITMQEPGASRLVSVDIEEAIKMAE